MGWACARYKTTRSNPNLPTLWSVAGGTLLADAAHRMAAGYTQTVDTLQDIVENPDTPDASRVAAARALLDYGLKFAELTDINKRLDRLEGML